MARKKTAPGVCKFCLKEVKKRIPRGLDGEEGEPIYGPNAVLIDGDPVHASCASEAMDKGELNVLLPRRDS